MKALVVFNSRTGITKKVAESIKKILKCDIEEIYEKKSREGVLGYLIGIYESIIEKPAEIKKTKKNPGSYNLVIIGTPVWAGKMSCPIRTYISQNKKHFKKIAFFCTMKGIGSESTFKDMEKLCRKKPIALLELISKEVMKRNYIQKVKKFVSNLR